MFFCAMVQYSTVSEKKCILQHFLFAINSSAARTQVFISRKIRGWCGGGDFFSVRGFVFFSRVQY